MSRRHPESARAARDARAALPRGAARRGMTLLELLLAVSIMLMVVGTLGVLARAAQYQFEYGEGHATATQHARVALERITRAVNEAACSPEFPGVLVVPTTVGTASFPDALVVWHPSGEATDPDGLPRYSELVVFCLDAAEPAALVELTMPDDSETVPAASDLTAWQAAIAAALASSSSEIVQLTHMLRVGSPSGADAATDPARRGAVRFTRFLQPSEDAWSAYQAGTLAWDDLSWVQGVYGPHHGLRQVRVEIELQLLPVTAWTVTTADGAQAVPFFGSAALYDELTK